MGKSILQYGKASWRIIWCNKASGIGDALLKEKPNNIEEARLTQIRKKVVSTIRLTIAPEIKYHYLKETDPTEVLEKLQTIYASKSLTNKHCLRWELYQLFKDEDATMQDNFLIQQVGVLIVECG